MIVVSNNLKNQLKRDDYTYKEFIEIEDLIVDVKASLFDDCYNGGNFIGTFIFKRIELETENDVDFKGKEFVYYKSIKVNGVWENIRIGTFIVTDVSDNDTNETLKVVGYDFGLKTAITYETNLDYSQSVTLQDVSDEVCDKFGFERVVLPTNKVFIVDSDQFSGTGVMFGDVIKSIAQITGTFAKVNENDNLEYIFNEQTDVIIEDYVSLEDKRDTHPITIVVLGNANIQGQEAIRRDEELIAEYGENYLVINDNPFAYTREKREQLIDDIFNKVKGFGYSSFKTTYSFLPYVQCGDLVKLKHKDGSLINSIILRTTSKYDDITLEAPSVIDATVDYEIPQPAEIIAKRAEIVANLAKAEIEAVVEEVEQISVTNINTSRVIIDSSGDINTLTIYGRSEQPTEPSLNYPIVINSIGDNGNIKIKNIQNSQEKIINIPIAEPLRSLPNGVEDVLQYSNGNIEITRNIGRKRIESIDALLNGEFTTLEITDVVGKNDQQTFMSEYLKAWSYDQRESAVGDVLYSYNGDKKVRIKTDVFTTIADFNVFLQENSVYFLYELGEPVIETSTIEEIKIFLGDSEIVIDGFENGELLLNYYTNSLLNDYATELKFAELSKQTNNSLLEINSRFDGYATTENLQEVTQRVEAVTTATEQNIQVIEEIKVNGVSQTITENNFTFNKDGLTLDEEGAKTKIKIDNANIVVFDKSATQEVEIFFAGFDEEKNTVEVRTQHLYVDDYLLIGKNSRIQDYVDENEEERTAVFWTGV